jgi:enoyl-CoA hydratase
VSEEFNPEAALTAGFFDELVDQGHLAARAGARAAEFEKLDMRAHTASKRRIRAAIVRTIRFSLPLDLLDAVLMGLRGARPR